MDARQRRSGTLTLRLQVTFWNRDYKKDNTLNNTHASSIPSSTLLLLPTSIPSLPSSRPFLSALPRLLFPLPTHTSSLPHAHLTLTHHFAFLPRASAFPSKLLSPRTSPLLTPLLSSLPHTTFLPSFTPLSFSHPPILPFLPYASYLSFPTPLHFPPTRSLSLPSSTTPLLPPHNSSLLFFFILFLLTWKSQW